jgi:hypothetical protein
MGCVVCPDRDPAKQRITTPVEKEIKVFIFDSFYCYIPPSPFKEGMDCPSPSGEGLGLGSSPYHKIFIHP